jgi:hypothetical protein
MALSWFVPPEIKCAVNTLGREGDNERKIQATQDRNQPRLVENLTVRQKDSNNWKVLEGAHGLSIYDLENKTNQLVA